MSCKQKQHRIATALLETPGSSGILKASKLWIWIFLEPYGTTVLHPAKALPRPTIVIGCCLLGPSPLPSVPQLLWNTCRTQKSGAKRIDALKSLKNLLTKNALPVLMQIETSHILDLNTKHIFHPNNHQFMPFGSIWHHTIKSQFPGLFSSKNQLRNLLWIQLWSPWRSAPCHGINWKISRTKKSPQIHGVRTLQLSLPWG